MAGRVLRDLHPKGILLVCLAPSVDYYYYMAPVTRGGIIQWNS